MKMRLMVFGQMAVAMMVLLSLGAMAVTHTDDANATNGTDAGDAGANDTDTTPGDDGIADASTNDTNDTGTDDAANETAGDDEESAEGEPTGIRAVPVIGPIIIAIFGPGETTMTQTTTVTQTAEFSATSFPVVSAENETEDVNVGGPLTASVRAREGFPQGRDVVYVCEASGGSGGYTYSYYFGDGEKLEGMGANTVYHTFEDAGDYEVRCVVTDSAGATMEARTTTTLERPATRDDDAPLSAQMAIKEWYPKGLDVVFVCYTNGGSGDYSYDYFFGDGSKLLAMERSDVYHIYPASGTYAATCVAHDDQSGEAAASTLSVAVSGEARQTMGGALDATLTLAPNYPQDLSVVLVCGASGGSGEYLYDWDFGDDERAAGVQYSTVYHTYASEGTYTPTCTVRDANSSASESLSLSVPQNATVTVGTAGVSSTLICTSVVNTTTTVTTTPPRLENVTVIPPVQNVTNGTEVMPSVSVSDQDVNGSVIVDRVVAAEDGWVVIHEYDGEVGDVVGMAQVEAGTSSDVEVMVNLTESMTLAAMLHLDAGEEGEFEFPGPDADVIFDGETVMDVFEATVEETAEEARIVVRDQEVDGFVTIDEVYATEDGWVVIHSDDNGSRGGIIGQERVSAGLSEDIIVGVTQEASGTLYAVLHSDMGDEGFDADEDIVFEDASGREVEMEFEAAVDETGNETNSTV